MVEDKAANILREYSDPQDKIKFGDAQKIHADLCNFCEGGAMTCVSAATLESCLTKYPSEQDVDQDGVYICNNGVASDLGSQEATQGIHMDDYYIKKLNATFFKRKDMAAHIQMMETQDAMLSRRLGTTIAPRTYKDHLHELLDYATLLDNRNSKMQSQRRNANNTNVSQ